MKNKLANGGSLENDTRLSTIKSVLVNFTGSGTLDLYTSFDGTDFVKKDALKSGTAISSFAYNPNYVKLLSSGSVSLTLVRMEYACEKTQFAYFSSFKGQYIGTLTDTVEGTEHERSKTIITVDDTTDKVGFFAYDSNADSWSSIDLYGLPDSDTYNADFELASNRNASDPAVVYVANFGTPVSITATFQDDSGTYHNYSFNGSKYTPATSITLKEGASGTVAVGDTFTLTAASLPWENTDTISWTTSNAAVVKFANSTKTGDKVSFKGVAAGTATITATAGSVSATYGVTVKAAVTFPEALKNTSWTGTDGEMGATVNVSFAADGSASLTDDYVIEADVLAVKKISLANTLYTLVYESGSSFSEGASFTFDSSSSALTLLSGPYDGTINLGETTFTKQ